jgi:predicted aldo/keto reductase-like oxidoreductase
MDTIRLGRTGMKVSRLGFGSIPIQRVSEDDAVAVVRRCLEVGVNFVDTANGYSTSEERIGKATSGRRSSVYLATKSHARTRNEIEKHLKLSLERLRVDYLDLYQFHTVNDFKSLDLVLDPNGPMAVVQEARRAGVVKHIGITSHQIDVAKKAVQSERFETIMFPFNFVTCEAADELLPLTREHDVGFIAMKPLAGGMVDNATIALKYLLQFPDVLPIFGIEKISEIEEIVKVLEGSWQMTDAEQQEMKRIKEELGPKFCHRCDYCQPCPQGIPISTVMYLKSLFKRLPPGRSIQMAAAGMEKAATCTECGECETRCPYHLPIREMLAELSEWYLEEKEKFHAEELQCRMPIRQKDSYKKIAGVLIRQCQRFRRSSGAGQ